VRSTQAPSQYVLAALVAVTFPVSVVQAPGASVGGVGRLPSWASTEEMVVSVDIQIVTCAVPAVVPWLQRVAVAEKDAPGRTLGGPLSEVMMKSGLLPIAVVWVAAAALLLSLPSTSTLAGSTYAPSQYVPVVAGMFAVTLIVLHAPGEREPVLDAVPMFTSV